MIQKVVTNDEAVAGSKHFFLAIFGTFERYITNLRGTFVENVKKSKINPPYWTSSSMAKTRLPTQTKKIYIVVIFHSK
jgi:hypothetical protein